MVCDLKLIFKRHSINTFFLNYSLYFYIFIIEWVSQWVQLYYPYRIDGQKCFVTILQYSIYFPHNSSYMKTKTNLQIGTLQIVYVYLIFIYRPTLYLPKMLGQYWNLMSPTNPAIWKTMKQQNNWLVSATTFYIMKLYSLQKKSFALD